MVQLRHPWRQAVERLDLEAQLLHERVRAEYALEHHDGLSVVAEPVRPPGRGAVAPWIAAIVIAGVACVAILGLGVWAMTQK